jgi:two-component system response regulator FixJ
MTRAGNSSNEIFIVDDDAATRESLSLVFTIEGYQVKTFADGRSFLTAARRRPPACVLLDYVMPGKSGLDILQELDARSYPAPIFIMSGYGDIATAVEAIREGACDFLQKGLATDALIARVREVIDEWHARRAPGLDGDKPLSQSFPGCDQLTPRERDVLGEIMAGATSKEAGRKFSLSPRTIENHRVQILQKLGAKNTVDLARIVLSKGPAA